MFGYIRPLQGELKVRELERFKACYCGMCHALGKKYGFVSRFILSYELVFLSMILWAEDEKLEIKRGRCIASPFCRKRHCTRNAALDMCAGYNVILTWWKIRDTIQDEPFIKAIPYRLLKLILAGAYKKASREFAGFDVNIQNEIAALTEYESKADISLDGAADKFARILGAAAPEQLVETTKRPMLEFLYHLGRWIYIIDACDDYNSDVKAGKYNPAANRYPPANGKLPDDSVQLLKTTLTHSNNLLCSAYELLPQNAWSHTTANIIYLGMPDACARVFEGKWPPRKQYR